MQSQYDQAQVHWDRTFQLRLGLEVPSINRLAFFRQLCHSETQFENRTWVGRVLDRVPSGFRFPLQD